MILSFAGFDGATWQHTAGTVFKWAAATNSIFIVVCSRFMGLRDWGTKGMLQRRLDKHMDYLLEDDKVKH